MCISIAVCATSRTIKHLPDACFSGLKEKSAFRPFAVTLDSNALPIVNDPTTIRI
jgi:hypothetical protein